MIVVTYSSLAELKEMVDGLRAQGLALVHVRVGESEYRQGLAVGRTNSHYVVLQVRMGDEIHLCKFVGPKYDAWGGDYKRDHAIGLDWSKRALFTIKAFCVEEEYVILPGFWWVKELHEVSGTVLEVSVEEEDFHIPSILK